MSTGIPVGLNIWSGCREGLGAALTNPTELAVRKGVLGKEYPVTLNGTRFLSAEAAYMGLRAGSRDLETMARVICEKFHQHQDLQEYVSRMGGVSWLEKCRHHTNARTERFQWWEGQGRHSPFIATLIDGYERFLAGKRYYQQRTLD